MAGMSKWVFPECVVCGRSASYPEWSLAQQAGWKWQRAWEYCPDHEPPVLKDDEEAVDDGE